MVETIWGVSGSGNYNALLAELKHQFSHQFMADAQFTWAKSMDTSSAPYFEQTYPYNLDLNYGRSDYNVGKAFKLFGMWQPVFFHGSKNWVEKIAGGWSLSGIFNIHSGFPWSPVVTRQRPPDSGGSLYCEHAVTRLFSLLHTWAVPAPARATIASRLSASNLPGRNFPTAGPRISPCPLTPPIPEIPPQLSAMHFLNLPVFAAIRSTVRDTKTSI